MRIKLFMLNIMLAVLWMFMWGEFNVYTLAFGFLLGYILLGIVSASIEHEGSNYAYKVWQLISFGAYFMKILVMANLVVAREIITPGMGISPAIIRYDVSGMMPFQITSLANAITLTPGTLSVDVSDDGDVLYVHCMYARDRQAAVRDLDELRNRMMKEMFG